MNILIIGDGVRTAELQERFKTIKGFDHTLAVFSRLEEAKELKDQDMIFDLNFDETPENISTYAGLENKAVIANAVHLQLAEAVFEFDVDLKCTLIGICALPTFINREKLELSLYDPGDEKKLNKAMSSIPIEFFLVKDRVGMVTPRVVIMIINEACYTV
ncbi:MAG: 3-hydroxyacyl-CoA dehydrogenase, partial [Bacteroidetes bacterium]|nr:3-hydroxyacyl-CoA dehydrogenase [Bacteroidota bacterium]